MAKASYDKKMTFDALGVLLEEGEVINEHAMLSYHSCFVSLLILTYDLNHYDD